MSADSSKSLILMPEAEESSFDPKQTWNVVRSRAWMIILLAVIGGLAGYAYLLSVPLNYYSHAVLQVDPQEVKVVNFQQDGNFANQDVLDGIVATIKTRPFLSQTVERCNLLKDPDYLDSLPAGGTPTIEDGVNTLMRCVGAQVRRGTRFIEIGVTHKNAKLAQKIANAVAQEVINNMIAQRAATSEAAVAFLTEQARRLKAQLHDSEVALQDYIVESKSISLKERQDTVVTKLKNQTAQAMEAGLPACDWRRTMKQSRNSRTNRSRLC